MERKRRTSGNGEKEKLSFCDREFRENSIVGSTHLETLKSAFQRHWLALSKPAVPGFCSVCSSTHKGQRRGRFAVFCLKIEIHGSKTRTFSTASRRPSSPSDSVHLPAHTAHKPRSQPPAIHPQTALRSNNSEWKRKEKKKHNTTAEIYPSLRFIIFGQPPHHTPQQRQRGSQPSPFPLVVQQ